MKTLNVHIKNFKNIENFTADFNGQNVLILGDNEVGKSSLIQFIRIAIGDQSCIPPNATGEGEVVMEYQGKPVKFSLKFKDGKPVIKVSGDGISIDNNKSAIAQLVGAVKFDVDEFVALSKTSAGRKKQVDDFKNFLDQEVKDVLNRCEANIKNIYDERTNLNRDIVKLEGSIKSNPLYNHLHELNKFQPIDVSSAMNELKTAQEHNAKIEKVKIDVSQIESSIESWTKEVKELQAKIDAYNAQIDAGIEKIAKANEWYKTHKPIDTSKLEETISSASETNLKAQQAQSLLSDIKRLEQYKDDSGEMTVRIDSEKQCIMDAVRDMDSPIDGLCFDEEQLLYNGIPVNPDSLSTSTIAELGVKLKRAENPNIPILLMCSESWGEKRFNWLKEFSKTDNFQFIAERVESGTEKLEIKILTD